MTKVKTYIATLACTLLMAINTYAQHTVTYDLYVNDTLVNYTGKSRKALAINGQIPAPALHFTEGDTAVIRVHNELDKPTSLSLAWSTSSQYTRRSTLSDYCPGTASFDPRLYISAHPERDILVSFTCQTSRTGRTLRRICYS